MGSLIIFEQNLIQIAGVIDAPEAEMLQQCGVRYLGFPLRLPVHREDLTEEEAATIIKSLAPPVFGVLITYIHQASEITALCHALGARIVQLHGDIGRDDLAGGREREQNEESSDERAEDRHGDGRSGARRAESPLKDPRRFTGPSASPRLSS